MQTTIHHASPRVAVRKSVPLASAEDLVIMKILAGRPKDVEDMRAIVAAYRDGLDIDHIERTLTTLEEALGQSDRLHNRVDQDGGAVLSQQRF